jgi:predicted O-linked N-acetylglucosamine transferase (SPINDLY family)
MVKPNLNNEFNGQLKSAHNLLSKGRLNDALISYLEILKLSPSHIEALSFALTICESQSNFLLAKNLLLNARIANPNSYDILNNLGKVYDILGDFNLAINCYQDAILLAPDNGEAHLNLGNTFFQLEQFEHALISYEKANSLNPNDCDGYFNLGNTYNQVGKKSEALLCYEKALQINKNHADSMVNQGSILSQLQRYDDALKSFNKALAINPRNAEGWLNKGVTLSTLQFPVEALKCFELAIKFNPTSVDAWSNKGNALFSIKDYINSISAYEKAIALNNQMEFLLGNLAYTKLIVADWQDYEQTLGLITEEVELGRPVIFPFAFLAMIDSPKMQRMVARIWSSHMQENHKPLASFNTYNNSRIRIGYFSADFYDHATAYLMSEFFELHDRNQFEIYAFSFGPNLNDQSSGRLKAAFDHFIDVSNFSDEEVALKSRELKIDIAVDLKGYTKGFRTGIFSCRAAPIQVNYLGYPGTMATDCIDYIIADKVLIPDRNKIFFDEKIVFLPNCYQVNDTKKTVSQNVTTRADHGLPESGFVFCCFNNNYKITPSIFDSWARILEKVDNSVLWLLNDNQWAKENLFKEGLARGIEEARLIFAERIDLPDHLARHKLADLFLDTTPYNAHTTTSDALWLGLPVITLIGDSFPSRVAASLLNSMGMPDLITETQVEYESLAIEIANDPSKLSSLKLRLRENRYTHPLFNTPLITSNIENAYLQMFNLNQSGLSPRDIYIEI